MRLTRQHVQKEAGCSPDGTSLEDGGHDLADWLSMQVWDIYVSSTSFNLRSVLKSKMYNLLKFKFLR